MSRMRARLYDAERRCRARHSHELSGFWARQVPERRRIGVRSRWMGKARQGLNGNGRNDCGMKGRIGKKWGIDGGRDGLEVKRHWYENDQRQDGASLHLCRALLAQGSRYSACTGPYLRCLSLATEYGVQPCPPLVTLVCVVPACIAHLPSPISISRLPLAVR